MTQFRLLFFIALATATGAGAATLPGFRLESVAPAKGFVTSIASDSTGRLYYTTTAGDIFRLEGVSSTPVAHVSTVATSNAGLLGMAFLDDRTAVVHYTTSGATPDAITYDVLSRVDLLSGAESVVHRFACDIDVPERGVSPEHHGGNPTVGPDGSIFVGIGDYGGGLNAAMPQWNGGKIWRIRPDGTAVQLARGLRNPFDLVWDDVHQRVIVPDNGPTGGDQIDLVGGGGDPVLNFGWPFVFGTYTPPPGVTPPVYVFAKTVAPTGIVELHGRNAYLHAGLLLTAFVTKAVYFIPDIDARPLPDPLALIDHETGALVDVTETPDGEIYFASGTMLYRLVMPARGDCDGNGLVDAADVDALERELADSPEPAISAQDGAFRGSWGCDANGDGRIDSADRGELLRLMDGVRRRSARSGR